MKKIGYLLFALIYNICSILCFNKKKKAVFFNGHSLGFSGNLKVMYQEIKKKKPEYRLFVYNKKELFSASGTGKVQRIVGMIKGLVTFWLCIPFQMATAEKVFFNDNFLPLAYMNPKRKKTQFVQLWHGAGAFKRFGLSTEQDSEVRRLVARANQRITHLFVTSRQIVPYYQEAFAIAAEKIYVTGIPETDLYFEEQEIEFRKNQVYKRYPEFAGKKLLLYTPTFRRTDTENNNILEHFNTEKIQKILGEEWLILVRMHPKYPVENLSENIYCTDVTDYIDIADLYLVADMLITDYSSTVVEYVLLDRPVILFAYDLEKYDRGFYRDYESTVPGQVAHDAEELYRILSKKQEDSKKRQTFVKLQYDYITGGSSERILKILDKDSQLC